MAKTINWGFDLTSFGTADKFKDILNKFGLKKYSKVKKDLGDGIFYYMFTWYKPGLKIQTGNNPLTGEYNQPNRRDPEKGYASYIGITGEESEVLKLKDEIKRVGDIKDESPRRRDYI